MATTAVAFAVAVSPAEDGQLPYSLVVAAGDSSALILARGHWRPVTAVKNAGADMPSNAVRALPREVQVTPVSGYLQPGEALVVVTDGIGDPMGTGAGEVGQFLAARWSRPPDLFAFATHAAFYRRGFTDDRTAVAVWHESGAECPDPAATAGAVSESGAVSETGALSETGAVGETGESNPADETGEVSEVAADEAGDDGRADEDDTGPAAGHAVRVAAGDSHDQDFHWFGDEGNGD
jgi:hypothetical protein